MMASKRSLFGSKLHADPEDRAPVGVRQPADQTTNQTEPQEAGAQRGAPNIPGAPSIEVDLLDDGGRQRGGWRSGIAIVVALSVFAGGLWYAYDWAMGQLATTGLPLIVADTTAIKSRPENPGGIEVLNQDVAVLNDVVPDPAKPQAERLLPPPEVPRVVQAEAPQAEAPRAALVAEVEELLGPPLATAAGPPVKMPLAEEVQVPAAPEPVLPEPKTETLLAPEPPPPPPVATPTAATPEPVPPTAATPEPAPQVAALPDPKTGGFVVQLAALRAKDGARPAWARLQKAHPALLGDRELAIQRADLGDRGVFYRIRAGFFADRAGARKLCDALKARGQDCLVTKR